MWSNTQDQCALCGPALIGFVGMTQKLPSGGSGRDGVYPLRSLLFQFFFHFHAVYDKNHVKYCNRLASLPIGSRL